RAGETRLAEHGGRIRAAVAAVFEAAGGDRVDAAEDPVADIAPAHGVDARVDPVSGGFADAGGHLGGVDEHLRGDTADVQARAPERAGLDDRDLQVVEIGGDE